MLSAEFYSDHRFDGREEARALFEFFDTGPAVFRPVRYDRHEPMRTPYDPDNLDGPIGHLDPERGAGSIGLKGKRHRFQAILSWNKACAKKWYFQMARAYFTGPEQVETWIRFVAGLCGRFPAIYGVAYDGDDKDAKHRLIQKEEWGERQSMKGLNIDHCLPPMGWMTVFGRALVDHFGRETLTALPSRRAVDLGNGGLLLIAGENPFEPGQAERLARDEAAMDILGRDYFFDLRDLYKIRRAIPGVTGGGRAAEPEDDQYPVEDETATAGQDRDFGLTEDGIDELFAGYENQFIRKIDEKPTTDFDDLAETVVVTLGDEVEEVHAFSRASLEALDRYLERHDFAEEYKYEFLITVYIPAFGAYVGQVLVRHLGGEWVVDEENLTRRHRNRRQAVAHPVQDRLRRGLQAEKTRRYLYGGREGLTPGPFKAVRAS